MLHVGLGGFPDALASDSFLFQSIQIHLMQQKYSVNPPFGTRTNYIWFLLMKASLRSICHIISSCMGMAKQRKKLLSELEQLCTTTRNNIGFSMIISSEEVLCQFILDPSSLNLKQRVSLSDPVINNFFKFSRQYCYIIDLTRIWN